MRFPAPKKKTYYCIIKVLWIIKILFFFGNLNNKNPLLHQRTPKWSWTWTHGGGVEHKPKLKEWNSRKEGDAISHGAQSRTCDIILPNLWHCVSRHDSRLDTVTHFTIYFTIYFHHSLHTIKFQILQ